MADARAPTVYHRRQKLHEHGSHVRILVHRTFTLTPDYIFTLRTLQEGGYAGSLYQRWFGSPNHTRFDIVLDHFLRVSQNRYEDYSYDCFSVGCEGEDKMLAYVLGGADDECVSAFTPCAARPEG